uniref:Uncharacterized protein n=1 Tax=Steinernema glaseri TaxID=37863 RepID=A0A1I7XWK8_9BILA
MKLLSTVVACALLATAIHAFSRGPWKPYGAPENRALYGQPPSHQPYYTPAYGYGPGARNGLPYGPTYFDGRVFKRAGDFTALANIFLDYAERGNAIFKEVTDDPVFIKKVWNKNNPKDWWPYWGLHTQ